METTTQIKIEALECELEKETAKINGLHEKIKDLMSQIARYESGAKRRVDELTESKKDLEKFKDSIPDFSEEICEMYAKYQEMKDYFERISEDYAQIDKRIEKLKDDVVFYKSCIAASEQHIYYLNLSIKEAESEETTEV